MILPVKRSYTDEMVSEPYCVGGFYSGGGWPQPVNRISDLRDPDDPQGRNYREVNAAKVHRYPVGSLVELRNGVRLFVVHHARDCDQTPLYSVAAHAEDIQIEREGFYNASWLNGIPEHYLTLIKEPSEDLKPNRNNGCPKGGGHTWIGDEAGDSWCEKCGEVLFE